MNRKQLIFLLAALAVIGGAGLVLLNRNKESWAIPDARMGEKAVPHFPFNEVAAIYLRGGGSAVNLVRKNDVWRVTERGDYPADFHQISDALIKVRDLKVVQSEPVAASQLGKVRLAEPDTAGGGLLAEFKDAQGKLLESMILGKVHVPEPKKGSPFVPSPDGRYVLLRNDPQNALLVSDPLSILAPSPKNWLRKDFIKVEHVKSISKTTPDGVTAWKVSRETETSPWKTAGAKPGQNLDDAKMSGLANMMSVSIFMDVVPNADLAATGLDKPTVATFETFDHFTYGLKLGGKDPEGNRYIAVTAMADLPAGGDDKTGETKKLQDKLKLEQSFASSVYIVGSWIVESLDRDLSQMMADKTEAAETTTPAASPDDPFATKSAKPTIPDVVK